MRTWGPVTPKFSAEEVNTTRSARIGLLGSEIKVLVVLPLSLKVKYRNSTRERNVSTS